MCKKLSGKVWVWLSVWSEVQIWSYGPTDAIATSSSLASLNPWFDLSGAGLRRLSWEKGPLNPCLFDCLGE